MKKEKKKHYSVKKIIIRIILFLTLILMINYLALVPLNVRFGSIWFLIGLSLLIPNTFLLYKIKISKNQTFNYDGIKTSVSKLSKATMLSIITGSVIMLSYSIIAFFSIPMFHAVEYSELIGEMPVAIEFTSEFDAVDTESNLPIIDSELAAQLGDKEFGQYGSLGSEFHVGEFHDLSVNGDLVSVAPLEFNDFFKWNNNKQGSPGYVIVNKTTGDVEVVNGLALKYMPSAYFANDLHRYLYTNDASSRNFMLIDFALELDDDSNPYWVINALKPTIGLSGGKQVMGVYIVNPITGEINYYKSTEAPSWVDTVYPKEIVLKQLDYWGSLSDGFLNSVFAEKNVLYTTFGSRRVYNDAEVYHYTGLTSASSDEATVGFVFVNTKTKEVVRYNMSGATETAAMQSAEGIVQNFGYNATFPIPMNVYNEATFLITLKDNKGLIKQYAFVNVSDFAIVGIGDSIDKAYSNYGEKLNIDNSINYNQSDITTVRGNITRINMFVVDGTSQYELLINGVLYTAGYKTSSYLAVTDVNDTVIITLIGNNIIGFHNVTLEGEPE